MKISSITDLEKLSINIIKKILPGDFILLYGEMGTGKTTFARSFINRCEKNKKVKESEVLSPTFNISFEYDVNDLPRLIKSSHNSDLVITYRYKRKYNTVRIVISVVYNMLLRILFNTNFRDVSTGSRLFKRSILKKVKSLLD